MQLCGYQQKPTYTLHKGLESGDYVGQIVILAKPGTNGSPIYSIVPQMPSPVLAIDLVAREALMRIRSSLPEMRQPTTFYLPMKGNVDYTEGTQDPAWRILLSPFRPVTATLAMRC